MFVGSPTFQWGLALVAPMVAATSAGQLGYHWAGVASFLLAICTALPVFGYCYVSLLRGRMNIPDGLAGTAWIPLGVVGQSTAAAHWVLCVVRFGAWAPSRRQGSLS